jgi:glycosyltransferase involved in cell wall biosynthesis
MSAVREQAAAVPCAPGAIRAAIVEPVGGHGGMHYYDAGLCRGLAAAGATPRLYTCDETPDEPSTAHFLRRPFRGIFGRDARLLRGFRYLRGLVAALRDARRFGATVAHFHLFHVGPLELIGLALARLSGHAVVATVHDVEPLGPSLTNPYLARTAYRFVERAIVHNRSSLEALVANGRIAPSQVDVIPHGDYTGLAGPVLARDEARRRLGLPQAPFTLLFFGQIKAVKGLDLLIEALAAPGPTAAGVRLLVAGRPWKDDPGRYRQRIDELGLAARCTLHLRFIPDEEVPAYFGAADLVVCPYRRIYQSGVVLMAMSLGRPVLVSDLPGMTEIVRDGETGFVFRTERADSLAGCLAALASDRETVARVAASGRDWVAHAHGWDRIGRMTLATYGAALGRRAPAESPDGAARP